jgi:hypothetical protein
MMSASHAWAPRGSQISLAEGRLAREGEARGERQAVVAEFRIAVPGASSAAALPPDFVALTRCGAGAGGGGNRQESKTDIPCRLVTLGIAKRYDVPTPLASVPGPAHKSIIASTESR